MKREEYLKKCAEYILDLEKRVRILNSLNYYDINISSENFFVRLLGLVYGWSLENMNHKENNTSAIDLYDKDSRIAVQVTSDDSANKIHDTIGKFIKKDLQKDYDRLVFMVITEDKNYRATFNTKGNFEFDKNKDIITCKSLINDIEALDTEKIVDIYNYLSFEFDSVVNNDSVWTIDRAVKYMGDSTDNILSLDYFEIDDNEFINNFNLAFNGGENIFVKGTSREETLYCVLNLLKNYDTKKAVYIIKNKETWNEFGKYIQEAILIPYFQDKEIAAIKGNINIFIYGIENHTIKNYILLRRRKMSTLEEKLKEYKDGGRSLVIKTNGLFPFIKKHLFNGQSEELPYANNASKAVIAALMIGQWTETEGDKSIIEEISGMTYSEFAEEVGNFINVEFPLFIKINGWNGNMYKISDVVILWSKYYDNITDEMKQAFYNLVERVVLDKDPLFNLPFEEHVYGSLNVKKPRYSNNMKKGMLQSLIFLAINGEQSEVDYCIKNILSHVSDLNMWGYIAQFAEQMCEASPSAFIEKIEKSKEKAEFIELFKSEGDFLTSRHYYTHILWAMEQLLRLKEYAPKVVRLLMYLTTKIPKCAISNSPSEVLSVVFCYWLNLYSISSDDKLKLAEIGVKQYESMWKIIFDKIESGGRAIMVSRSTFDYRQSEDGTEVACEEAYKVSLGYLNILIGNAGSDVTKWIKLIELFAKVPDDFFVELCKQLELVIERFEDREKEKIKTKLRKEIYRHRFFCRSDWAMDEWKVCEIERLCKNIKFNNPAYDFIYLINPGYAFPLYNPKPMEDDGRDDENEKLKEKVLYKEFKRIKSDGIDICKIIELKKTDGYTQFGSYIAQYYSEGKFDKYLYKKMLKVSDIRTIIIDYVVHTYRTDHSIFDTALKLSAGYDNSNDLYVGILKIPEICKEHLDFVCKQDEDIQKKYFSNMRYVSEQNQECRDIFIKKCLDFNCSYSLLDYLYETKKEFTADEIIELLYRLSEMPTLREQNGYDKFLLEKIVEYTHSLIKGNFDKYEKMCILEIRFFKLLSWEQMLCTQYLFKTNASLYASVVEIIFRKDKESCDAELEDDKKNMRQFWWDIHYNAKFCPGEIDGKIEANLFEKWIIDFEKKLSDQNQSSLFTTLIGELFAYSPIGDDGFYPHECVRNVIETRMDDSLKRSYFSAVLNKRGVYTVDAGEGEKKLALNYQKNADGIRIEYPKTAEIYDMISKYYFSEANTERERAEDGRL